MKLTSERFNSLRDLFVHTLEDICDAEQRIIDAMPDMIDAASLPDLKQAFQEHLDQTRTQKARLENIFATLGHKPESVACEAMKGLIKEGEEAISAKGDDAARDAALIMSAQKIEHYEIASYGSARTFAEHLGLADIASTLQLTLEEEGATDKRLTQIAETCVNAMAAH